MEGARASILRSSHTLDRVGSADNCNDYDTVILIDEMSLTFLDGSTLDFIDDLSGSFFQVNNPNASSSCGCGTSFSI